MISGYHLSEVKGKEWFSTFLPECDQDKARSFFRCTTHDIHTKGLVSSIITRDGRERNIEWHTRTLKDRDGSVIGTLSVGLDITEQRVIQETLQREHAILTGVFEGYENPIFSLDHSYRYTSFNSSHALDMKALYGADIQIGGNFFSYQYVQGDQESVRHNIDRALSGERFVDKTDSGDDLRSRRFFNVSYFPIKDSGDVITGMAVLARDVTAQKEAENHQNLAIQILKILNEKSDLADLIKSILHTVKNAIGLDAVAIRLKNGEDYPYYSTEGLLDFFVQAEPSISCRDTEENIIRNEDGTVILECMCGNIINGRTDSHLPFFTKGGSFWSNDTTELLASTTKDDLQTHTRNRCNIEGYESIALIPLRRSDQIIGLLQLNDTHKNCFTLEMIEFFEGLGASIGIALERMRVDDELFKSEQKYEILARVAPVGIIRTDPARGCTYINELWGEITGLTFAQAMGSGWKTVIHPDDRKRVFEEWRQSVIEKRKFNSEYRFKRPDGGIVWVINKSIAVTDKHGRVISYIGMITDISERKHIEDQLREITRRLTTLISTLPGVVFRCRLNPLWTMEFISDGCFNLTGYTSHDLTNNLTIRFVDLIPHEQIGVIQNQIFEALQAQEIFHITFPITTADGKTKWVLVIGQGVFNEGRDMEALEGFITDVSEQKKIEEALKDAITQINENLKTLAILNDEIRNPLTIISLLVDTMNKETSDQILDAIHRIDKIINQLDRGWLKSEKVRLYLMKHYGISSTHNKGLTENWFVE